jgi:UPF0176 protein
MRTALILSAVLLVAACAPRSEAGVATPRTTERSAPQPTTTTAVTAPAAPEPTANGPCPYLSTDFVQDANGQRVTKVRISADKPNPACFFYRADGKLQLTAWVFTGDPKQAKALVDQSAPVATANPAELPGGWKGGAQATSTGAVYAVAKEGSAVVVTTNQEQTIKAKRVVEKAIETLGI